MYLFNYYFLQWHADTNKLLKFTNLHDLSAFGNCLHFLHCTNTTLGFLYRNVLICCQRISAYLRAKKRKVSASSIFSSEVLIAWTLVEVGALSQLTPQSWTSLLSDSAAQAFFFFLLCPKNCCARAAMWKILSLGIQGGASDLTVGCSAIFIKVNGGERKKGKRLSVLMQ